MPELPEVETIVRQLDQVLPGKVIQSVGPPYAKATVGAEVVGKKILRVLRKQKIIEIDLLDDLVLLVHLKMTGQLIYVPSALSLVPSEKKPGTNHQGLITRIVGGHPTADWVGDLPSKHTRVIFQFTDNSILYFNDQRKFGWVRVVPSEQWLVIRDTMAPDVVDPEFTVEYLGKVLKRSSRAIKLVILDQAKMGGMGNIYACDALFAAGIHPLRKSSTLHTNEITALHQTMISVLHKGIETGGASLSHFVDTSGLGGHYQDNFMVYDREGQPCKKCNALIQKFKLGGRGTYFCPNCQR